MDMNIRVFVEIRIETQFDGIGADPGQRRLCRFLHDLANLTGYGQMASALRNIRFDKKNIAADVRPRKSHSHTRHVCHLVQFIAVFRLA